MSNDFFLFYHIFVILMLQVVSHGLEESLCGAHCSYLSLPPSRDMELSKEPTTTASLHFSPNSLVDEGKPRSSKVKRLRACTIRYKKSSGNTIRFHRFWDYTLFLTIPKNGSTIVLIPCGLCARSTIYYVSTVYPVSIF